jgi:sn-glycerol 3-phosphate transport system substrate-binding protein
MKRITLLLTLLALVAGTAMAQTKIEFWHAFGDQARQGWIQDRADEWNAKHTDFQVEVTPKGSYRDTLNAAILAARQGTPPDIIQIFEVGSQQAFDSGLFIPVGDIPGAFDTSDYIQPVLNYYTIGGTVNSIPFNSSNAVLYINEDLMKKAGLDPANPPKTFSDVIADCDALRAAGDTTTGCMAFPLHSWFVEQWMAEQNAPLTDNGNGRDGRSNHVLLTSDAFKNIVSWIKDLQDKGYYSYTGTLENWSGSDAIFTEGKAMFHITSTADIGNNAAAVGDKFTMNTAELPIPDGSDRTGVVIGGASVWIMKDHPEARLQAARDFVLYMTNTENMMSWHKLTGYFPVRVSSVDQLQAEGWFDTHPRFKVAFDQLLNTQPTQATAGALIGPFPDIRTIIEEAIQKVINGASVDSAMTEASKLADNALQQYNSNFQ